MSTDPLLGINRELQNNNAIVSAAIQGKRPNTINIEVTKIQGGYKGMASLGRTGFLSKRKQPKQVSSPSLDVVLADMNLAVKKGFMIPGFVGPEVRYLTDVPSIPMQAQAPPPTLAPPVYQQAPPPPYPPYYPQPSTQTQPPRPPVTPLTTLLPTTPSARPEAPPLGRDYGLPVGSETLRFPTEQEALDYIESLKTKIIAPPPLPTGKFCGNCGASLTGTKFCQSCGSKV